MHIALVSVHVKPDAVAAFEAATEHNARQSRLEPGVARFDVLQQRDDPTRFVLFEVYRDPEAAVLSLLRPNVSLLIGSGVGWVRVQSSATWSAHRL